MTNPGPKKTRSPGETEDATLTKCHVTKMSKSLTVQVTGGTYALKQDPEQRQSSVSLKDDSGRGTCKCGAFYFFIFLFMRDTQREAETQAEGEAGSMQGAQRRTRSRDPRVTPWAEGGVKLLSHPGCPSYYFLRLLVPGRGV